VEKLLGEYYGSTVPLQQLAGFQVPEARTLVVKPHDRGSMAAIEKSIRESDLGLQPSNDGVVIRLSFPVLTEERRKEYVKVVKNMAEDGRIEFSKDDLERAEKELDKFTQEHIEQIDKAFARKEQELLEV
jgi:ribosome recycling factor